MTCRCETTSELHGNEATAYADAHLQEVETRAQGWEIVYRCPTTGLLWLLDYPHGEQHGGGPARLRHFAKPS
jgi:Immunity protein 27